MVGNVYGRASSDGCNGTILQIQNMTCSIRALFNDYQAGRDLKKQISYSSVVNKLFNDAFAFRNDPWGLFHHHNLLN